MNAHISISPIQNGVLSSDVLARGETDENGSFLIDLPANASDFDSFYVDIRGAEDGSTLMNCDAESCGSLDIINGEDADGDGYITWGESVFLSSEFHLSSTVDNSALVDDLSVSITPLSHFAVERAKKDGDLSPENIQRYMQQLASLLNLPYSLSQLTAVDPSLFDGATIDLSGLNYGVLNASVAAIAADHGATIESTIQAINSDLFNDDNSINRERVLEILKQALSQSRRLAAGNPRLQTLITDIQLLINQYRCESGSPSDLECAPVVPPKPPEPSREDLQTVKRFVKDFRSWARDIALQSDSALPSFKNRLDVVDNLWEDDIRELASVLNDLLPGVAQAVSPANDFCFYCANFGYPVRSIDGAKQLELYGLTYTLLPSGEMTIRGSLRGVDVNVDLLLPQNYDWNTTVTIAMTAGRLSKEDVELVISEGSYITAGYPNGVYFSDIAQRIVSATARPPEMAKISTNVNFHIAADYEITPSSKIDFEDGSAGLIQLNGWNIVSTKASQGTKSLQSSRIRDSQRTRANMQFNSGGGYLSFDYSVESESCCDYLSVYVDGNRILRASNSVRFKSFKTYLSPGSHSVVFEYAKDGSVSVGRDAAWIDNISLPNAAVNSSFKELATRNVITGQLAITAEKLPGPWYISKEGYLPSDISINAHIGNDYLLNGADSGDDSIHLNFAANFANISDFKPPKALPKDLLTVLGQYSIEDNVFILRLPDVRMEVSKSNFGLYSLTTYSSQTNEVLESYGLYLDTSDLHVAAGALIENSAIGWYIVRPNEGLFVTTLINASPWSEYSDSQFSAEGGNIYGYLVDSFQPTETNEQFLRFAASLEMSLKAEGFPLTKIGAHLSRDSFEDGVFDFYIELEGKRFNVHSQYWLVPAQYGGDNETEVTDRTLSIVNQDGVELHIVATENETDKKDSPIVKGELVYKGVVFGEFERIKGLTLIQYIDGSGESLE